MGAVTSRCLVARKEIKGGRVVERDRPRLEQAAGSTRDISGADET